MVYLRQPGENGVKRVRPWANPTQFHFIKQLEGPLVKILRHVGRNPNVESDDVWHHPRKALCKKARA